MITIIAFPYEKTHKLSWQIRLKKIFGSTMTHDDEESDFSLMHTVHVLSMPISTS